MHISRFLFGSTLVALAACRPDLNTDDKDPSESDEPPVEDSDSDTELDTAPVPPCELPESEPNNTADAADELVMEAAACGTFNAATDADFWRFELTEEGWLGVDVKAYQVGSEADVSLALGSDDAGVQVAPYKWHGLPDVHLVFPSPAGTFDAIVRQAVGPSSNAGEGDRFFYDLRASVVKAPVIWSVEESDNETSATAQSLVSTATGPEGLTLLGAISTPEDQDWYEVQIPPGRHRVVLDIDAHEFGSAGDFLLRIEDPSGLVVAVSSRGQVGWEDDAWLERHTVQAATWRVRVVEEDALSGAPFWYALTVTVEAE